MVNAVGLEGFWVNVFVCRQFLEFFQSLIKLYRPMNKLLQSIVPTTVFLVKAMNLITSMEISNIQSTQMYLKMV